MKLKLVKLENRYKQQLFDMLDEWYSSGEKLFLMQSEKRIIMILKNTAAVWK